MTVQRLRKLLGAETRLSAALSGAAHVLDIGSTLEPILFQTPIYDPTADLTAQDLDALRRDWQAVGDALRVSMEAVNHGQEIEPEKAAAGAD